MIKRLRPESGYSMVEVLAAIVILSLAILPMVSMFDAGLRAAVLGANYDKARSLANANLEEAKARGYEGAEAMTDCPSDSDGWGPEGFDCELDAEHARLEGDEINTGVAAGTLLHIEVTVTWDNNKKYRTSRVFAPGGIG